MSDPSSTSVQVRCVQLSPLIGAVAENLDAIDVELESAVAAGVGLLVLPELATCGYSMTPGEARAAALPADGPVVRRWTELLRGSATSAVIGFCEDGGEVLHNSAVALVPGADPVVYRKLHLWDTEKLLFEPGEETPPIVRTPVGSVGVIICYDLEFPELPRTLALAGAEVLAVPANWPLRPRPDGERPHEVIHAMAAAQASGIVVACCDRSGEERGTAWIEGTTVVGADGWPVGELDSAHRLDAHLSLPSGRRSISDRNHLFEDRRPEFYRL